VIGKSRETRVVVIACIYMAWHDIKLWVTPRIYKLPPSARDVAPLPPRTLRLLDNSLYDSHRDGVEVECLEKFLRKCQKSA
jgi:hypothetical protein